MGLKQMAPTEKYLRQYLSIFQDFSVLGFVVCAACSFWILLDITDTYMPNSIDTVTEALMLS